MRRVHIAVIPLALAGGLLCAASVQAATVVKLTIDGIDQTIECVAYEQSVRQPKSATGQATGNPVYDDIICRKRIDASSPALFKAISTGQPFKKAVFRFTTDGAAEPYTVTISDVLVTGVKQFSPGTSDRPAAAGSAPRPAAPGPITSTQPAMEDVSFSFGRIEVSQGARTTATIVR